MKDFGFALNNSNFSDRVLQIEIVSDVSDSKPMSAGSALHSHDSESELFGAKVTTLHISSLLLAQQSPFFYKLFENGMKESQQRDITLTMNASEEAGLKDVLNFIYKNTLNANTVPDLVNVLMVADKYEVVSCMEYCCELLQNVPMSLENALLYIGLPSSVLMGEQVEHLLDVTKEFLVKRYKYLSKSREEAMTLPLPVIEVVLSSKGLQVNTEDGVFRFILEWVRAHYPEIEERKEIVAKHLVKLICFPSMTSTRLKEVVDCPEFDNEQVLKLVLKALLIKVEVPYGQPNCCTCTTCTCLGRIYEYRPIKMEQFEVPQSRCTIYFNLKKEECEKLFTQNISFASHSCIRDVVFFSQHIAPMK